MNRPVKFRAIFDGKIVEHVKWENCNWMYSEDQVHWYFERKHAHTDLAPFTDLTDARGREIYEGDIIQPMQSYKTTGGRENRGRLPKLGKSFCKAGNPHKVEWKELKNLSGWNVGNVSERYEVIGNIYENSDLLV